MSRSIEQRAGFGLRDVEGFRTGAEKAVACDTTVHVFQQLTTAHRFVASWGLTGDMAFAGLSSLFGAGGMSANMAKLPGVLLALTGSVGFAVGTIFLKRIRFNCQARHRRLGRSRSAACPLRLPAHSSSIRILRHYHRPAGSRSAI
jgi:hypothetical protein